MQKSYDVVIVGAGPAGSSASRSAALGGAETLMVERKREVGLPVRCGEFLPSFEEMKKLVFSANAHITHLSRIQESLSHKFVTNTTSKIRVYSPENKAFEFDFKGAIIRRDMYDKILVLEAEKMGATLKTSSTVRAITDSGNMKEILVRDSGGDFRVKTKLVIGADGFPSNVGRWAKLESGYTPENMALCIQQKIRNGNLDDDVVEIFFGSKYAPGGYAWIIPKGDGEANIGLGVRLSQLKKRSLIIHYLNTFLKNHPIASKRLQETHACLHQRKSMIVKTLPAGGLVRQVCGNKVLLAGDAAGTVIPTNGAGIQNATVSGHIAGEVSSHYINGDWPLSMYATILKREMGDTLKRGLRYRRFADVFTASDNFFEKILQLAGTKNIAKVLKCEPLWEKF